MLIPEYLVTIEELSPINELVLVRGQGETQELVLVSYGLVPSTWPYWVHSASVTTLYGAPPSGPS